MISVDLSSGQHTPMGRALHKLYYGDKTLVDLAPNRVGYPHNGGQHSFYMRGEKDECVAWLQLFKETYPATASDGVDMVLREIESGQTRIKLRVLEHFDGRANREHEIEAV